jgi:predicted PhzF superfamily epimerase YddE/YHI9
VLHYLVDLMGPEKVMLGSDYPFPLGEVPSQAPVTGELLTAFPGELIQESNLSLAEKEALLGGTCMQWLGLDLSTFRKGLGLSAELASTGVASNNGNGNSNGSDIEVLTRSTTVETDTEEVSSSSTVRVTVVDAFTAEAYSGNPAAVVMVPRGSPLSDGQMRKVARQMNLSETAFITLLGGADDGREDAFKYGSRFGLRWLTPDGTEVALCGHGTLAAATALAKVAGNSSNVLAFETLSGDISATRVEPAANAVLGTETQLFRLSLPANVPVAVVTLGADVQAAATALVSTVLGASTSTKALGPQDVAQMEVLYSATTKKLLVVLPPSPVCLVALRTGLAADLPGRLRATHDGSFVKGVIVSVRGAAACSWDPQANTQPAGFFTKASDHHFESRYFAPWVAIPEDPVTGSAHTVLAPYWGDKLAVPVGGGHRLRARQCSARGGNMLVCTEQGRVLIDAPSTVALRGQLAWPSADE